MRIAYSCAGEGMGHAMRTAALGPLLERRHRVTYFVPGSVRQLLAEKMGERPFERIPHFSFKKRGERVRILATLWSALPTALLFPAALARIAARLRSLGVQAVISDFEPFLPWAARLSGIPVFQVNHPGIVQRVRRLHPLAWPTAIATRLLEGPWSERVHISFYSGDAGPIIRREVFAHPLRDEGFALLNLKRSYRPLVLPILEGAGLRYRLFPDPAADFEEALSSCSWVLSSAGHQIIAESLALNKPILVIPQRGQWEQRLNAEMVAATGKGRSTTLQRLARDLPGFVAALDCMRDTSLPPQFDVADSSEAVARRMEEFLRRECRGSRLRGLRGARSRPQVGTSGA